MNVITEEVKVLIVDDQEAFRSAARLVVELTDGFVVAGEASSGEDGVQLADEVSPHLVLMDINLPGIDGLEATRRIVEAHPDARVLVFSTYEATEYESRAHDAGAIGFVPKSEFSPTILSDTWSELD